MTFELQVLHAFAKARHGALEFFETAAAHVHDNISNFPYHELTVIAWACARMNAAEGSQMRALLASTRDLVAENPDRFTPSELAKLLWSFATVGMVDSELAQVCRPKLSKWIADEDLVRLMQVSWPERSTNHLVHVCRDCPRIGSFACASLSLIAASAS